VDRAHLILRAAEAGWRPPPRLAHGYELAELCVAGLDPFGRYWTPLPGPARRVLRDPSDRAALAATAEAAETFLALAR